MPELLRVETQVVQADPVAARLQAATASMSGRLAELIGRVSATAAEPVAGAQSFLAAMAGEAAHPARTEPGVSVLGRAPVGAPHPVDRLAERLELSALELDLLVLAGLPEQHEGYASVLRSLDPEGAPFPAAGLAAELLCPTPEDRERLRELIESGPAVARGVLLVPDERPFFDRSLRLPSRLWSALHGLDAWPAALGRRAAPRPAGGFDAWLRSPAAVRAVKALSRGLHATILVAADSELVAHERGAALAERAQVSAAFLRVDGPIDPALERLVDVHAAATGAVPVLRVDSPEQGGDAPLPLTRHPGPAIVCVRGGRALAEGLRPVLPVPVEPLDPAAARAMWSEVVPGLGRDAEVLGRLYRVEPHVASAAAADTRAIELIDGRPARLEDVTDSLRARAGANVTSGLTRLRPRAGFDQLVLSDDRVAQLHEALRRLEHQRTVLDDWGFLAGRPGARGVRLLFAGPPGTGKTLSAEVMAGALGVEMLVVDLSRTVSKWLGETEKNLAEAFDAAERSRALLLFDEADALFGRRTEVADAHDRYANLETAYLLARLERFDGIAILATNLRRNIDPAFTRRLEFVVPFEEPGPVEREALWRCHLPPSAPLADDLDVPALAARYPVVGAVIRNAATAAAFLAAADGEPIGQGHVVQALRREYEKSGRAFAGPNPTTSSA
jgi:hypothetical protein